MAGKASQWQLLLHYIETGLLRIKSNADSLHTDATIPINTSKHEGTCAATLHYSLCIHIKKAATYLLSCNSSAGNNPPLKPTQSMPSTKIILLQYATPQPKHYQPPIRHLTCPPPAAAQTAARWPAARGPCFWGRAQSHWTPGAPAAIGKSWRLHIGISDKSTACRQL